MQQGETKFGKRLRQAQATKYVTNFLTTSRNLKARPARYDVLFITQSCMINNFAQFQRYEFGHVRDGKE